MSRYDFGFLASRVFSLALLVWTAQLWPRLGVMIVQLKSAGVSDTFPNWVMLGASFLTILLFAALFWFGAPWFARHLMPADDASAVTTPPPFDTAALVTAAMIATGMIVAFLAVKTAASEFAASEIQLWLREQSISQMPSHLQEDVRASYRVSDGMYWGRVIAQIIPFAFGIGLALSSRAIVALFLRLRTAGQHNEDK